MMPLQASQASWPCLPLGVSKGMNSGEGKFQVARDTAMYGCGPQGARRGLANLMAV